ncbi:hypothetical protein T484DRAFT_1813647 [Baffinella frigidus]|nr:hypothetical protein T484DRAFT_1813647 [Cryptophyta sp. CCMP2293]
MPIGNEIQVVYSFFFTPVNAILDALAVSSLADPHDYGRCRLWGAVGVITVNAILDALAVSSLADPHDYGRCRLWGAVG